MIGDNQFTFLLTAAISAPRKRGRPFANAGGPKKATGRGDARWNLIPEKLRRDVFVTGLQLSPKSS